jgi:hypothetical protein
MNRARDRREGTAAYEAWKIDRQAELDTEKAAADAAQAAAAQTPEERYKAATNQLFSEERNVVLNGIIIDSYLAQFGTIKRGRCSEEQKVAARMQFRQTVTDYVRNNTNGATLVAMVDRNNLHPGAVESYLLCHELCKLWSAYVDADPVEEAPAPVAEVVPVEVVPVLSRSEQAILDHHAYVNDVVGTDEMGRQWTEEAIDRELSAKDGLRLRRLFEQGHRGSNLLTVRREILDIKQQQDAERNRMAQEEER